MRRRWRRSSGVAVLTGALLAVGCGQQGQEGGALLRGDEAWARGDLEEALAEYRLAAAEGGSDDVLRRVAHAFAQLGRVDDSGEAYRTLLRRDPRYGDQATADMLRLAHRAQDRGDVYGVASALQLAMEFRPGVGIGDLALPLARHYSEAGEHDRALPLFQRALTSAGSEVGRDLFYEVGRSYEQVGDCERALTFLTQYRETAPRSRRTEVDWHIGTCSFQLGQERADEGRTTQALDFFDETIAVGEPKNLLAQAYFEKAELHAQLGECSLALDALEGALREAPSQAGPLAERAARRIDDIRFRRGGGARC